MHPGKNNVTADIQLENILIGGLEVYYISKCKWFFTTYSLCREIDKKQRTHESIIQQPDDVITKKWHSNALVT